MCCHVLSSSSFSDFSSPSWPSSSFAALLLLVFFPLQAACSFRFDPGTQIAWPRTPLKDVWPYTWPFMLVCYGLLPFLHYHVNFVSFLVFTSIPFNSDSFHVLSFALPLSSLPSPTHSTTGLSLHPSRVTRLPVHRKQHASTRKNGSDWGSQDSFGQEEDSSIGKNKNNKYKKQL